MFKKSKLHVEKLYHHVAQIEIDCAMYSDRIHLLNSSRWRAVGWGGHGVVVLLPFWLWVVFFYLREAAGFWEYAVGLKRVQKKTDMHRAWYTLSTLRFFFPNHFYIHRSFVVKKDCMFLVVLGKQFDLEREESTRFLDIYLHVDRIPEYKNMKKRKMMRKPIFLTLVRHTIWDFPHRT